MENSTNLIKKANITPVLHLAQKKEGGGTEGTGRHVVKLLKDELDKRTNFATGEEEHIVWYYVEEDGIEKKYAVPVKDGNGDLHYLVQRLGVLKPGTEVALEYKRKGVKGYISVDVLTEDSEEDIVIEGEDSDKPKIVTANSKEKDEDIDPLNEQIW